MEKTDDDLMAPFRPGRGASCRAGPRRRCLGRATKLRVVEVPGEK